MNGVILGLFFFLFLCYVETAKHTDRSRILFNMEASKQYYYHLHAVWPNRLLLITIQSNYYKSNKNQKIMLVRFYFVNKRRLFLYGQEFRMKATSLQLYKRPFEVLYHFILLKLESIGLQFLSVTRKGFRLCREFFHFKWFPSETSNEDDWMSKLFAGDLNCR